MDVNENTVRRKCWMGIKFATVILCVFGFCCNSFVMFKDFVSNQTVTSNDIKEYSTLVLPSVTMCGLTGFTKELDDYADLEHDKYINHTINLNEILSSVVDSDSNALIIEPFLGSIFDKSGMWNITTTYSAYRGRCYTIEYKKEVPNWI